MAKLATIGFDDDGNVIVTHTDLSPPPQSAMSTSTTTVPPPSPKKRVPSSPHKPYTSNNFYDLTKSSPDISPFSSPEITRGSDSSTDVRVLKERDRENIIPRPFAKTIDPPKKHGNDQPQGFRKGTVQVGIRLMIASQFIDPGAILPANSALWKSSKVNVRKPSYKLDSSRVPSHSSSVDRKHSSNISQPSDRQSLVQQGSHLSQPPTVFNNGSRLPASMTRINATTFDIPSNAPRPPPYIPPSSSFIHPDTVFSSHHNESPTMTAEKEQEALKNFFEAALEPEKDEEDSTKEKDDENDDEAGKVDGLYVTLMKHQISGLEFLCNHETTLDKKGKGKYGGILADDVPSHTHDAY